jgi:predicted CXXCH cytochrome family protein
MKVPNMFEQGSKEEGARVMRKLSSPMKRLLFIGLGSAMVFAMGGVGTASADGGPHSIPMAAAGQTGVIIANMGADQCANCHRAHTAKTDTLTMLAQPAICLNCHDGSGSTLDVVDGIQTTVAGTGLRGGGFTQARIGTSSATKDMGALVGTRIATSNRLIPVLSAGAEVTSTHQIDGTTSGTIWGNGTTGIGQTAVTLECGSCHDPHGNGNYRILKPSPTGQQYIVTPAVIANPLASPPVVGVPAVMSAATNVNIPDQVTKNYTVISARSTALVAAGQATGATAAAIKLGAAAANGNYWDVQADTTPLTHGPIGVGAGTNTSVGAGATVATDGYLGNISAWCTTCHTRYLSTSASATTGDAVYTYKHRSDEGVLDKPNCIQCHVSHGSNALMQGAAAGVTNPDGTAAATYLKAGPSSNITSGDSRLLRVDNRGVCLACHNM